MQRVVARGGGGLEELDAADAGDGSASGEAELGLAVGAGAAHELRAGRDGDAEELRDEARLDAGERVAEIDAELVEERDGVGAEVGRREADEVVPLRADVSGGEDEVGAEALLEAEGVLVRAGRLKTPCGERRLDAARVGQLPGGARQQVNQSDAVAGAVRGVELIERARHDEAEVLVGGVEQAEGEVGEEEVAEAARGVDGEEGREDVATG